jgi:AAT family amino acid transporter
LSARQVPTPALALITVGIAVGIAVNLASPEGAFSLLVAIAACAVLGAWTVIVVCHLRYRTAVRAGRLPASDFKMPGAPVTNWVTLALVALVVVLLGRSADTRVALYVGAGWALLLAISYAVRKRARKSEAGVTSSLSLRETSAPRARGSHAETP